MLIIDLSLSLCSVAAHIIYPRWKGDSQKLIRGLTLLFVQLILQSPGQRYNADGYILSPVQNVFRPTPPFLPGRCGGSQMDWF
ncbi:hypothetical protein [Chitinophaga polysaccharea]|uniref:hypothetical protein n=1 Tax=Chitinophaga polysaccharea TaxID=1293035 RepID=UPI00119FD4F3|nr:hypothetical protein [Chitinophaga polysaccharea]